MKITREQLNNFPFVDGRRACPYGDYKSLRSFERCTFDRHSEFRTHTKFVNCRFRNGVRFAKGSVFKGCDFGDFCSFDEGCSFDDSCHYGHSLYFGQNCTFNGHLAMSCPSHPLFICDGSFNYRRTLYFFNTVDGLFVQAGCFFGHVSKFLERTEKECQQFGGYMSVGKRRKKFAYPALAQLAQTFFAITEENSNA